MPRLPMPKIKAMTPGRAIGQSGSRCLGCGRQDAAPALQECRMEFQPIPRNPALLTVRVGKILEHAITRVSPVRPCHSSSGSSTNFLPKLWTDFDTTIPWETRGHVPRSIAHCGPRPRRCLSIRQPGSANSTRLGRVRRPRSRLPPHRRL